MMERLTVVIEYKDRESQPSFGANMECLGGRVVAVQFDDALAEIENIESGIERPLTAKELAMGIMVVTCLCCDETYKTHRSVNSLAYSNAPNYGCHKCKGSI